MRLVLIEWMDSYGCSSHWQELQHATPAPLICKSVGWLFHDADDCKVIIPHLSSEDHPSAPQQGCGDMTIPARAILKMVELAVPCEDAPERAAVRAQQKPLSE